MTQAAIKKIIEKRFGTMSNFARQADIDRYELQKFFARKNNPKKALADLHRKATKLKVGPGLGEIDPQHIERLREAINASGGVLTFCKNHPEFNKNTVFQVLAGKYKRMSPGVQRLFVQFGI